MKTQSAQVREWLIAQGRPCTVVEIAAAPGLIAATDTPEQRRKELLRLYQNVHRMWREKILSRTGVVRKYRFTVARDPMVRPRIPEDEMKRRRADKERARRNRRLGPAARTRDQYLQECAARRQARIATVLAAKAARKAARDQERAERQAAKAAARPKKAPAKAKAAEPRRPAKQQPSVTRRTSVPLRVSAAPQVESVEAWMVRTGKKPERIPPGVVSHPLRHIGEAA